MSGGKSNDPVGRLAQDLADVGREEARALRDEAMVTVRGTGTGVALLGVAGLCAVLGIGAASAAMLRLMEAGLPRRAAATVLAAGYFAAAIGAAGVGLRRLRAAGGGAERLADQVSDQLEVLRQRMSGAA